MANLLTPMVDDQDFTAAFFNTAVDNMRSVAYQTADATVNNSAAVQQSPDLWLPMVAGGSYIFESCLFYDTTATADITLGFLFPTYSTIVIAPWAAGVGLATVNNQLDLSANVFSTSFDYAYGGFAAGTVMCVRPTGRVTTDSTTSGRVVVRFAQYTPEASNTILKQGSWISLARVA